MDIFGSTDPRKMPMGFFSRALFVDFETAKRGDWTKQNFTVAPRHWYIDAEYECPVCKRLFIWTARLQRQWFEKHRLYVDAQPHLCKPCRRKHSSMKALRQEYDMIVEDAASGDLAKRKRVVEIVASLDAHFTPLPEAMVAKAKWFTRSLESRKEG